MAIEHVHDVETFALQLVQPSTTSSIDRSPSSVERLQQEIGVAAPGFK